MTTEFEEMVRRTCASETLTVYTTANFEMLNRVDCNRKLNEDKVKKFMEHGVEDVLYLIGANGEIIDGQHRIEACRRMGKPIRFIIMDRDIQSLVLTLNAVGSPWAPKDYINYYKVLGRREYELLQYIWKQVKGAPSPSYLGYLLAGGTDWMSNVNIHKEPMLLSRGYFSMRVIPQWVINAFALRSELHKSNATFEAEEKIHAKLSQAFIMFCVVLQHWACRARLRDTDVMDMIKRSMLANMSDLSKGIYKNDAGIPLVLTGFYGKVKDERRVKRPDWDSAFNAYKADIEANALRELVARDLNAMYHKLHPRKEN